MNNENLVLETEGNSFFKRHFSTVTTLSKNVALILFISLPFVGGWIGYKFSPEKIVIVEKFITKEVPTSENKTNFFNENSSHKVVSTTTNKLDVYSVIKTINDKYGYGPGPQYVGVSDSFFWFVKPNEKGGCKNYSYIDLNSGEENETNLTACPVVDISESYPFHVVLCPFDSNSIGEALCVTSLLTLEEKKIQVTKNLNESVIEWCEESTFDPYCKVDIQSWDGGLLVRIYKSIPREPNSIYENTERLREENFNLFKEFGLE